MAETANDYRLKIKKLKYKIQKEENEYKNLRQIGQQYKSLCKTQLSQEKVFKKINFLLQLKGMSITDWVNAASYDQQANQNQVRTSQLLHTLDQIGVKLQSRQKHLLQNFLSSKMSEVLSLDQIIKSAQKAGVRTEN